MRPHVDDRLDQPTEDELLEDAPPTLRDFEGLLDEEDDGWPDRGRRA